MITEIVKRSGETVPFDPKKIETAVAKAFSATREKGHANIIAALVESQLPEEGPPTVEAVQDLVEENLMRLGFYKTAKAYILYRKNHQKIRDSRNLVLDVKKQMEDYINAADWRVKENATVTMSIGGLILSNSGAMTANYWLNEVYDEEIAREHRDGAMHLHDLSMLTGYCAGWNLKQLIQEGLGGVEGKISSSPASHLSTLCNQMVNFLGILQNEWAGAQAFSSFDTYLAPFVKADNLSYKEVKQCIQSFVFGVNTPSRWGTQAPFSNITLDWTVPRDLADLPAIVGGKEMSFTYGDCKKEMDMVNKAFIEVMIEGDANGRGFQYPIPTYSITKDFDWSATENNQLLFEMTAKYGTPYFSNYINSEMDPSDVRSMCPLYKDENVLVMDNFSGKFHLSTVENLYNGNKHDKEYTVLLNGATKKARLHRFDNLEFYRVRTVNGHEVILSHNHTNLVLGGEEKPTSELTTKDYLPFNIVPFKGSDELTYEDGLMVGAFMGDGCLKDDYSVTYSLNSSSKAGLMADIIRYGKQRYGAKVSTCDIRDGSCTNVTLTSKMLRGLIEDYVSGKAPDKELSVSCINRSLAFRQGILDGLLRTDGNLFSKRIYTASPKAVKTICTMLASMGIPTNVVADTRTKEDGKLGDSVVYCIRMYNSTTGPEKYKDIYVRKDGYQWFRIVSIEKLENVGHIGYCFEVLNDDEPYFMLPSGLVTHNCRLRLDLRELRRKSGGFFGSGESTGSIGVVTLDLPRIGYLSTSKEDFYERLDRLMDIAARSLDIKRKFVTRMMDQGMYPYTKRYLGSFDNHFSTIGLVGMNEAAENASWLKTNLTTPEGQAFAEEVLNHMRERLSDYQELYGALFNLEATPAESTTYRLAKHDVEKYPDIITAAKKGGAPYYTNSSHIPVGYTDDIFEALELQDNLQTLYTSGTVFHAFLGERLPDWKTAATLVRKIAENYKLPYYTLSPTYSVCQEHGYLSGEHEACPICGKSTEVYSRITGYYRPLKNWNDGKAHEYQDRREYTKTTEGDSASCKAEDTPAPESGDSAEAAALSVPKIMLFASKTCPNCKIAEKFLGSKQVPYEVMFADEHLDLVHEFNIMQAPTLIVMRDDGSYEKLVGAGPINGFAERYQT